MRRDIIGIGQGQQQKYDLQKMLVEGNVTLQDDGRLMAMSYRHARRPKRKLVSGAARG
jgi:predicted ribosome quality control (RQC) complex YloA/Tae2 family protein